jgi:hypothetical protein
MKRLAVIGAVTALSALVVIGTAGGQAPQGHTLVLTWLTKQATFTFVDNAPKAKFTSEGEPRRLSPGDREVFSIPVADQQGKRVGRFDGECVVVRPGTHRAHEELCTGAYRLGDGVMTLATALIGDTGKYSAAVTGGTGAYATARGTVRSVTSKSGTTDTVDLLP